MRLFIILLLFAGIAEARENPEKYYQDKWCKGETEHRLSDGTRVDCMTVKREGNFYAVEVEFADKWAESGLQALHYGLMTGRKPGIVIIVEDPKRDLKYLNRLYNTINGAGLMIRVWVVQ